MSAIRLLALGISLFSLAVFTAAAAAQAPLTPANGGCMPGGDYDPACDVDHDGEISLDDIMLTAGHWGHTGTWDIEAHDHLGETWVGNNDPLVISGTFNGWPDAHAPLVLNNPGGDGVLVGSAADDGVQVDSAGGDGVYVNTAGEDGIYLDTTGGDALHAYSAGGNGVYIESANYAGLHVSSATEHGVYVNSAGWNGLDVGSASLDGVYVRSAGDVGVRVISAGGDGVYVDSAGLDGLDVGSAGDNGVYVGLAGNDGVHIDSASQSGVYVDSAINGINVNSANNHGLKVTSAGIDGVRVIGAVDDGLEVWQATGSGVEVNAAGNYGVYANTTNTVHGYGVYTPDKVGGSNIATSSQTLIARVSGDEPLSTGDIVAAAGVAEPLPGSAVPLTLVRLADGKIAAGAVGVVEGRRILVPQEVAEDEAAGESHFGLHNAEGPAEAGDYVALTVLGVAQVKVDADADIQPGQRLTASDVAGKVRALKTVEVEGVRLAEDAPSIGVALASPEPGQETIPVFITLR